MSSIIHHKLLPSGRKRCVHAAEDVKEYPRQGSYSVPVGWNELQYMFHWVLQFVNMDQSGSKQRRGLVLPDLDIIECP